MRKLTAAFTLLIAPGIALAQSPAPSSSPNAPHVRPAPTHRASPAAHRPSPRPSVANHGGNHGPANYRVNLTGEDVQKILASPSPGPSPTKQPPSQSYPEPDVFHDTHN